MTFTEIVDEIADRLSYTSPESLERVGRQVNWRYRRLLGSIGLDASTRDTVEQAQTFATSSQMFTFENTQKLYRVWRYDPNDTARETPIYIREVSIDEIRMQLPAGAGDPQEFAVYSQTASSITVLVDVLLTGMVIFHADVQGVVADLTGDNEPMFDRNYHSILVDAVLQDENRKLEKVELARDAAADYERGVSDLRMFLAKNTYLKFQQGRNRYSRHQFRQLLRN